MSGRGEQKHPIRPIVVPSTFQSLGNYNFRLFWFGQLFSVIGTWMQTIGQAWLVLNLTGSPLALGSVTALQFLPILVFTLFAGVFVDRLPKRRLLLITQFVSMMQALALAVLVSTGNVQLWHVYVLATMLGLVNALDNPARQSFVIELVGREDLVNAVALNSTLFNAARIVGPAIGGVLIASVGIAECFYLNALSFVGPIVGLLLIREESLVVAARRAGGSVVRQLQEGLSYATRSATLMPLLIVMAAVGCFGYNFTVAMPLLARYALNVDADGFGALMSAMGAGSLVGALLLASQRHTSLRRVFLGAISFTLVLAALATSPSYVFALVVMVPLGFAGITFTTAVNTLMQLAAPDGLRGRVLSLYTLLFLGTTPIGGMITGALADRLGIRWTLGIEALACAIGVLAALAYHHSRRARSEGGAIGP